MDRERPALTERRQGVSMGHSWPWPTTSWIGDSTIVSWQGDPRSWQRDRVLVLYRGPEGAAPQPLRDVLGPPFAADTGRQGDPAADGC